MKAVMISIRPEWCEKIASGKKTIEVRKTRPKIEPPFKCYIYCTDGNTIYQSNADGIIRLYRKKAHKNFQHHTVMNGKVIGEFICDAIIRNCEMSNADVAEQHGCIRREALLDYSNGKELFGWHITNLVIYDEPMQLKDFKRWKDWRYIYERLTPLTRAPQSWCYIEELRG